MRLEAEEKLKKAEEERPQKQAEENRGKLKAYAAAKIEADRKAQGEKTQNGLDAMFSKWAAIGILNILLVWTCTCCFLFLNEKSHGFSHTWPKALGKMQEKEVAEGAIG